MATSSYEYVLPVFVGHPFQAAFTEELRQAVNEVCQQMNVRQTSDRTHFWQPDFLNTLESSRPQTILETITEIIRQSALCLFEVTETNKANIFFELGVAVGMNRRLALMAKRPYIPPSDLQGVRRIEYETIDDLIPQLQLLFQSRIIELSRPPDMGQDVIYQKMQIDANWKHRLQTASKAICFFAGDLSWATSYASEIQEACERGVTVRICCRRPRESEARKWNNIEVLHSPGVEIKLVPPHLDPVVRGFIHEPDDLTDNTEVMLVEKTTRQFHSYEYERTGVTIGESKFLYRAHIYRGNTHLKHVSGFVRLFDAIWDNPQSEVYS